ncbi:MAG: NUDIX domain-containing protein [Magnetococcus sp. DMHC-8]
MKAEILNRTELYRGFVRLEKIRLRYQRFDGQMSPEMDSDVLLRSDSVAVLPYDPVTDMVILIRQFRIGAYLAGERQWSLEIVAGGCTDDDWEANARREVLEEIGWEVASLHPIATYYSCPNLTNERVCLFLGIIDSTNRSSPGGGLLHENEDIQTLPMPFSQAMALLDTGQLNNSPVFMSMQWLARHRDTVRQQAQQRNGQ